MEVDKAKEKEEVMSQKLNDNGKWLEDLNSNSINQTKLNDTLQSNLGKLEEQNESLKKVIDKFYMIRQNSLEGFEDVKLDEKCSCLLQDPVISWTYNDPSRSTDVSELEEELENLRSSVDYLTAKLNMSSEIENHLKKKVHGLEEKNIHSHKLIMSRIADLRQHHSQQRVHIMSFLAHGASDIKWTVDALIETLKQCDASRKTNLDHLQCDECKCRDAHNTTDVEPNYIGKNDGHSFLSAAYQKDDASEAFSQAMQEKVAALLLLSQQDERHLLERNVNAALQKKIEELHRNLLQVTNDKVKGLMELARMKEEYQLLQEKASSDKMKEGKVENGKTTVITHEEGEGKLKSLLKKTYLNRWIGPQDSGAHEAEGHLNYKGRSSSRVSSSADYARMKFETATLKESMEVMEHLTSSIHRIRLALIKVKESVTHEGCEILNKGETLDDIVTEANLVKTALGRSLPMTWSTEANGRKVNESGDAYRDSSSNNEKMDSVSAAGIEMVELLIFAAQTLKDNANHKRAS